MTFLKNEQQADIIRASKAIGNVLPDTCCTTSKMFVTAGGVSMFVYTPKLPAIRNVIFNPPATIVYWDDNTKTVVKCGENDAWDAEKGLAMAVAKKAMGNKGNYNKALKRWIEANPEHARKCT